MATYGEFVLQRTPRPFVRSSHTDNVMVTSLPARQQGRLAVPADSVPPVTALAFVYSNRRATVTVLQSMADRNSCLKRIGPVVTNVHRCTATVADHHPEPLFVGNHLRRSISTAKEGERLALTETMGLLDLGDSRIARS